MSVAMIGRGVGSLLRTAVIMRNTCGSSFRGIVAVMTDMKMLASLILRKVINRVADRRYASISGIERKDQRQKEGEKGSHLLVILSHWSQRLQSDSSGGSDS